MCHRVVTMVALVVAQALTAASARAADQADLRPYVDAVADANDRFWREAVGDAGQDYRRPTVVVVDQASTGCGGLVDLVPNEFAGLYCVAWETIYLDLAWLAAEDEVGGRAVVAVVLAHEWGHHVQHLLGVDHRRAALNGTLSARTEQQADCLAGAWVGAAEGRALVTADEVDGLAVEMARLGGVHGDAWFVPDLLENRHGTGAQRARAFLWGYADGVDACVPGWATAAGGPGACWRLGLDDGRGCRPR